MARAVKKPLGGVRGRVGDVIYRYMNGRTFISVYNDEVNISYSPNSIKNRSKFGTTIKFAKAVNSVNDLNKIWNFSSEPGRSAYTKIFKSNHLSIQPDLVSPHSKITPVGVGSKVESFELNPDNVTIKIKIDRSTEECLLPPYVAHFVVFLRNPDNPEIHENIAFAFASESVLSETPDEYQTIKGNFIDQYIRLISYFKNATVFFAITKTDSKLYEWLTTESKEFVLS
ncbi:MAG: hypothetical protein WCK13_04315 [Ignavibacteriota bacterium]|nr:hypothetical protein [Ignavibacteriota bacterium]